MSVVLPIYNQCICLVLLTDTCYIIHNISRSTLWDSLLHYFSFYHWLSIYSCCPTIIIFNTWIFFLKKAPFHSHIIGPHQYFTISNERNSLWKWKSWKKPSPDRVVFAIQEAPGLRRNESEDFCIRRVLGESPYHPYRKTSSSGSFV